MPQAEQKPLSKKTLVLVLIVCILGLCIPIYGLWLMKHPSPRIQVFTQKPNPDKPGEFMDIKAFDIRPEDKTHLLISKGKIREEPDVD